MTLVLNGTTGVSAVDGSASTPAIQGNDTNTGVFFPAADTVAVATGGSERVRVDSSGNVGVGTSSPWSQISSYGASGATTQYIGFKNADGGDIRFGKASGVDNTCIIGTWGGNRVKFYTNGANVVDIDTSGNLLVATTNSAQNAGAGVKLIGSTTVPQVSVVGDSSLTGTSYIPFVYLNLNATNNGYRFYVSNNGGIYNYSANNSNLSDIRTKKDIELAGSYLQKICAIPVKTFRYIDQDDDALNLGVIAQDVEQIAPELVNASGFGDTPEDGVPLKSIYQTDLQYALMKCIQELNAKVESLTAEIATLKGAQA